MGKGEAGDWNLDGLRKGAECNSAPTKDLDGLRKGAECNSAPTSQQEDATLLQQSPASTSVYFKRP